MILLMVFHQSVRNRSFFFSMRIVVLIHIRSCWGDRHCVFFIDKLWLISKKRIQKKKCARERIAYLAPINNLSDCSRARFWFVRAFFSFSFSLFLSLSLSFVDCIYNDRLIILISDRDTYRTSIDNLISYEYQSINA